jgi:bifunctional UDP-N-acetylglucosamine pyrophosphorylase/glucosamine-1-phosphate N-acetyltransferase
MSRAIAGIILAAGKGTRMKSDLPKCLHPVCGVPMADLVGRAMMAAGVQVPILVVGHGGELLQDRFGDRFSYAWQHEQLGTGHATLMAAESLLGYDGPVFVAPGDVPLLSAEVFQKLVASYEGTGDATVATVRVSDPTNYGRILRDTSGLVTAIVEEKDATDGQKSIKEVNSGVFVFDAKTLFEVLPTLEPANKQGEYYLTDMVSALRELGRPVRALEFSDPDLLRGVNDRWSLAEASKVLRTQILRRHAMNGVSILDPDSTYVEPDVEVGVDTILEPSTQLLGKTKVGDRCRIGPSSLVEDSLVGDDCIIFMSRVAEAEMQAGSRCGPFANIRPNSVLGPGVKIGNFVEVKNSKLHGRVSVSHLTYLGDSEVGEGTNIGAGTITCNYDGFSKNRTLIGANVFIGSNSTLIAPVEIGNGAMTAAGSVVSSGTYPEDALVIGRTRTEVKEEWAALWRRKRQSND